MKRILIPVILLIVVILAACYFDLYTVDAKIRSGTILERFMNRVVEARKIPHNGSSTPGSEKSTVSASRPNGPGPGAYIRNSRTYQNRGENAGRPGMSPSGPGSYNNRPFDAAARRREMDLMRAENAEWIKNSTREYSPDSWYLLMQYDTLPSVAYAQTVDGGTASSQKATGTFLYLRGRTKIDMLSSMETNVHEITHGYFDQNLFRYVNENNLKMNRYNAEGFIYLSPSSGYFVSFPLRSLFPSHELSAVIPENLRTYRFETYVDGTTSTQSDGVIGLLNELDAYYIGSRYCFDMLEAYKIATGSGASGLFEWVTHTQSTMSAFYELDFFIREYLLLMKKNYTSDYNELLSCRPFVEAYSSVHNSYKELIDKYTGRIKSEMKLLNSSGEAEVKAEKGWLWIKSGNSNISSGTPVFSDPRDKLLPVLSGRRYRDIAKEFQIK
jgi:hypothetical protein